jgi:hypothetical protein
MGVSRSSPDRATAVPKTGIYPSFGVNSAFSLDNRKRSAKLRHSEKVFGEAVCVGAQ